MTVPRQKSLRPRDSQRSRVYRWEEAVLRSLEDKHPVLLPLPCEAAQELVQQLWFSLFKAGGNSRTLSVPSVVYSGLDSRVATGGRSMIVLPLWAENRFFLFHELTHSVMAELHPDGLVAFHGPEFCLILLEFLTRCAKLNRQTLIDLAVRHRVRFAAKPHCRLALWFEEKY